MLIVSRHFTRGGRNPAQAVPLHSSIISRVVAAILLKLYLSTQASAASATGTAVREPASATAVREPASATAVRELASAAQEVADESA